MSTHQEGRVVAVLEETVLSSLWERIQAEGVGGGLGYPGGGPSS